VQVAIVLYPRFTALDVVGPYEVLSRIPGVEVVFVAEEPGPVADKIGSLTLPAVSLEDVTSPDLVLVGGGPGQPTQATEGRLRAWLRAVDQTSTWMAAVGTGTLVLAEAGLLDGRHATTHWLATEQLKDLGVLSASTRVVVDGKYATGAGVSAAIDMALALAGLIAGDEVAEAIQLILEYAPEPPYDAGTPEAAPSHIVEELAGRRHELVGKS
jgi:transcriptional regulator GlxA family with amidase domain